MLTTPPTTVQRWVDYLEKEHLIRRDPHPTDRRTAFVSLLAKGRSSLDDYLAVVGE
jgi:DNA-binding MarR family transcriptional regulator